MVNLVCCICGAQGLNTKNSRKNVFFQFPVNTGKSFNSVVQRRLDAWKKVVGSNYNKYKGIQCVCAFHFHSGIYCIVRLHRIYLCY